jgi:putative ABC transport system permease protein
MGALDRKLVRDLWRLRGHVVAVALVAMCGTATFLTMHGAYDAIRAARDAFYRDYRFGDVFATATRVPAALAPRLLEIDGVAAIDTRVAWTANLDVRGFEEPATGRIVSLPESGEAPLDAVHLRAGSAIAPGRADEVLVNEAFARAHRLVPGDTIGAVLNGRAQRLRIAGIAISPDYVNAALEFNLIPDHKRFGIVWMSRPALEAALDMRGAFNRLSVRLAPGAVEADVIAAIDRSLARYGGRGAYGRADQFSHRMLEDELRQDRVTGTVVPAIFLAVAAFLVYNVLVRLIGLQRAQIGVLKAFGYTRTRIAAHFVALALAAVGAGAIAGLALGAWMGEWLVTTVYGDFFYFPWLEFRLSGASVAAVLAHAALAAMAGAAPAVLRATRLAPAEAMRPEPPAHFRPTLVERAGLMRLVPLTLRMTLRNLERRPVRALLSLAALALAAALVVMSRYGLDAVDEIVRVQFRMGMHEDVVVYFGEPRGRAALHELARLPGVGRAEPFRMIGVRVRNGHRVKRTVIHAQAADAELRRIVDRREHTIALPSDGLVMAQALAAALDVRVGDEVTLEVLEGRRHERRVPVVALVDEYVGLQGYMDLRAAARLLGEDETLSGAYLAIDRAAAGTVYRQLRAMPAVAAVGLREAVLAGFYDTIEKNVHITTGTLIAFACAIAAGMVYNGARIALSEHAIELASLRILGFTRGEVATLIVGEQALLVAAAVPLGCLLGYGAAAWLTVLASGETYRLPLAIGGATYGFAIAVVLGSAALSALVVLVRLRRFDLVAALKTRE